MNETRKQLCDILSKQVEVLAKKSQHCKPEQLCKINQELRETIKFMITYFIR